VLIFEKRFARRWHALPRRSHQDFGTPYARLATDTSAIFRACGRGNDFARMTLFDPFIASQQYGSNWNCGEKYSGWELLCI
jgi:hypothetical protein